LASTKTRGLLWRSPVKNNRHKKSPNFRYASSEKKRKKEITVKLVLSFEADRSKRSQTSCLFSLQFHEFLDSSMKGAWWNKVGGTALPKFRPIIARRRWFQRSVTSVVLAQAILCYVSVKNIWVKFLTTCRFILKQILYTICCWGSMWNRNLTFGI